MTGTPTAGELRRAADRANLDALAARSSGRIRVLEWPERAGRPIRLGIGLRTASSTRYPAVAESEVRLRIDLPARYPFERPVVQIESPIFHPNVFPNGTVCQGEKWLPGDALDIVVQRIIRLLAFEPDHVNPASAANRTAASWYLGCRRDHPGAFPTDRLTLDTPAAAAAATAAAARVVVPCPACQAGLRLPAGRQGLVECPRCHYAFDART